MADKLISQLGATAAVLTTDLLVKEPNAGPPAEKATVAQLVTLLDTIYLRLTGGQLTGSLTFSADNTHDIGAAGATRPRTLYVGTNIVSGDGTGAVPSYAFSSALNTGLQEGVFNSGAALVAQGAEILLAFNGARDGVVLRSDGQLMWNDQALNSGFAPDIGFSRNAAGIVEVNNATTGTFRDLWARHLRLATAFTVATLPAAGVAGRMAYVTDATAPTYNGALVGGGAVVVPVFDNGAAWVST